MQKRRESKIFCDAFRLPRLSTGDSHEFTVGQQLDRRDMAELTPVVDANDAASNLPGLNDI